MLSAALFGIEAAIVQVEVHASGGLPAVSTVGLPDSAVRESRERVRSAILNSGLVYPKGRITVNLAPADMRKIGSSLDLPMAAAIAAIEDGVVTRPVQEDTLLLGELSLDGNVRPVAGVLSVALEARARGIKRLLVPLANGQEAALVDGIDVSPVSTLAHAIGLLNGTSQALAPAAVPEPAHDPVDDALDMADVKGQQEGRRALEIAAAGGHNLLLIGPPGTGKTLLARRLPTILPPLTIEEAMDVTRIRGAAGEAVRSGLVSRRPFRSPHHTATHIALIGGRGGPAGVRPGEASMAHHGVLFLDELPEFQRNALEVLRQPLEEGAVTIARASRTARFPSEFLLVASMNPCPCGYRGSRTRDCTCTPSMVARYLGRISGPLLDRIDMHVEVPALGYRQMALEEPGETSRQILARVVAARGRQRARNGSGVANARMPGALLRLHCALDGHGREMMERSVTRLGLSVRSHDRILRVARTIADLTGSQKVLRDHLAEAIQYRAMDRAPGASTP